MKNFRLLDDPHIEAEEKAGNLRYSRQSTKILAKWLIYTLHMAPTTHTVTITLRIDCCYSEGLYASHSS